MFRMSLRGALTRQCPLELPPLSFPITIFFDKLL